MLRFERLSISNGGLKGRSPPSILAKPRAGSPAGGSIFTTSAPQSASTPPAAGPATQTPSSTTRTPSRGPTAASLPCAASTCSSCAPATSAAPRWARHCCRAHLEARGVDAHVHSAGTLAWGGPATANAVLTMHEHDLAIDGHLSRALTDELVVAADLVLGMTRDHVWRVTRAGDDVASRAFLVGELARLGSAVGARAQGETVRAWAARVAATRPAGPVGRFGDEVDDPVGEPLAVYRATAVRLDRHLGAIAALLAP